MVMGTMGEAFALLSDAVGWMRCAPSLWITNYKGSDSNVMILRLNMLWYLVRAANSTLPRSKFEN